MQLLDAYRATSTSSWQLSMSATSGARLSLQRINVILSLKPRHEKKSPQVFILDAIATYGAGFLVSMLAENL